MLCSGERQRAEQRCHQSLLNAKRPARSPVRQGLGDSLSNAEEALPQDCLGGSRTGNKKSLATQRHFFKVSEMDVLFSTGEIQKALRGMIHLAPAQRMFEKSCKKQN